MLINGLNLDSPEIDQVYPSRKSQPAEYFSMEDISLVREDLLRHRLYQMLDSPEKIRIFMQHHIFAVWDFMSLLKRLQRDLTCIDVPWTVQMADETAYTRFINEIVLCEESDDDGNGGFTSHFELYIQAMRQCEADTDPIETFLKYLKKTGDVEQALENAAVPESISQFVQNTLRVATTGKTHEVCAAFFFGREEIIPAMFQIIVDELEKKGHAVDRLVYYLKRHIEIDGDEHGPLAERLLDHLSGESETRKEEAARTAHQALKSRIRFWDGVCAEIANIKSDRVFVAT